MSQKVTFEQLEKLAGKKLLENDEPQSAFFKEFKQIYREVLDIKMKELDMVSEVLDATCQAVERSFLKMNCPPIEFVGEGSSRVSYALDGGKCLKIAKKRAGVAQNKAEVYNINKAGDLAIFPRHYADIEDFKCILVECVAPCSRNGGIDTWHFLEVLKAPPKAFSAIESIFSQLESFARDLDYDRKYDHMSFEQSLSHYGSMRNILELEKIFILDMLVDPKNRAQRALRDIFKFMYENPDDLVFSDLGRGENWGFAVRDEEICPVVLDAGFSREVKDNFY